MPNRNQQNVTQEEQPIYVQLLAQCESAIKRLGLKREEKAGWVLLIHPETQQKVYIRKAQTKLPRIESTLQPGSAPGVKEYDRENGRIHSLLDPDPNMLIAALEVLGDEQLEAPRRGGTPAAAGSTVSGSDVEETEDEGTGSRTRRRSSLAELLAGREPDADPTAQIRANAQAKKQGGQRRNRSTTGRRQSAH